MALLQILLGLGILVVAYRGHQAGEIRAGSAGFERYTPSRQDAPLAFHAHLLLYICAGLALLVWGVFALLGLAEPMPVA
jgi:hypothetical protein